ncbi:MAG: chemotaxis-specific protein-glutamate methyltransferase CheB [Lachnospiraceae bacterium]|nr:chemotaxis-specific protein-glutamate methyltransferase CheB [Lachnospiraceae bacterium]
MKKILFIDDSALMRSIFCDIINSDHRFVVEDTAADGQEGLKLLKEKSYDLILLDLMMPNMDGITFLKKINQMQCTSKVVIFSMVAGDGTQITIEALSLGAADFITKPQTVEEIQSDIFKKQFFRIISSVVFDDESDFVHSNEDKIHSFHRHNRKDISGIKGHDKINARSAGKIVAIASSTGGPKALMEVMSRLPADLDAPVLVVQHMPAGFTESLAKRLDSVSALQIQEASDGIALEKGHVYIAKGGLHMEIKHKYHDDRICLFDGCTREGVKPCANYMFESLAHSKFQEVVCVVLTGMGADGTEGIKRLKCSKQVHVITQSKETCSVYGMPRAVDMAKLTDESVPLDKVAEAIIKNVGVMKDGC